MSESSTELATLCEVISLRHPHIIVSYVERDPVKRPYPDEPDVYTVVTYKSNGPWYVCWNGSEFGFSNAADPVPLGAARCLAEIEAVADEIDFRLQGGGWVIESS
ncbi:hypothetical protein ACFQ07_03315 [Actinomadura adrarensis]|uniref:Immunity protein 35 domain-containing protein n=1 Tax=Actinomadura adrarensis TaxID=1819600 RepID=A0ABW3CBE9_9ACTN